MEQIFLFLRFRWIIKQRSIEDFSNFPFAVKMSLIQNEETNPKNLPVIKQNENVKEKTFVKKDKWANDVEFLLSCISLSVVERLVNDIKY